MARKHKGFPWWGWLLVLAIPGGLALLGGYSVARKTVLKPRGIRNNNPGNIKRNSTAWQGLAAAQTDAVFFQFSTMFYGIRAMVRTLYTYTTDYKLDTIAQIINRWAREKPGDDTSDYANAVAKWTGRKAYEPLRLPSDLLAVAQAMARYETGWKADEIADAATWAKAYQAGINRGA